MNTTQLDPALSQFRDWLVMNFGEDASVYLHESVHVAYYRAVGENPKVYGPHWMQFRGEKRWALGSVSALPDEIERKAPALEVGKCHLASMLIEIALWPECEGMLWARAEGDLENFNTWFSTRYRGVSDLVKQQFIEEVRVSVIRELKQPSFRDELFWTAIEYEARISEDSPEAETIAIVGPTPHHPPTAV
jgi:hypothetical protein